MHRHRPPTLRAALLLVLTCTHAFAAPTGGLVTSGSGSIARSGATTTVSQASNNLSLNWATFNVAAAETVRFNQPSASAIAVNRIADVNGSTILGNLQANGQVFLINPHGLIFGAGSQVNVGGLVASTLDIANADLASGSRHFAGTGSAAVVNNGTLTAAPGGYVALLGSSVTNVGTITAPKGSVALGAGSRVTLDFAGNKLLCLAVTENTVAALAANGGLIRVNGGAVYLSAGARDSLVASVINNTGVIEARTVDTSKGTIILLGGMAAGTTTVAGTLDASAPSGGNGGSVETSAALVKIDDAAKITTAAPTGQTGTWLVDLTNFTIAAGTGATTTSGIGADTLARSLNSTSVTLATAGTANGSDLGDILVNAPLSWSANTLTLSARNNIFINENLTGTGTARLALLYGQGAVAAGNTADYTLASGKSISLPAGASFSTQLGSDGAIKNYTVITRLGAAGSNTGTDLQGMQGNLVQNYALGADIDASVTSGWNSDAGFAPIGDRNHTYRGTFTGLGHAISNLTINLPLADSVGLFGYTSFASIRDVGLFDGVVRGNTRVGGLVGTNNNSTIRNAYHAGTVSGSAGGYGVGGLVGWNLNPSAKIIHSNSTGVVTGDQNVGGLVGYNNASANIVDSSSFGAVTGNSAVGGLVGYNYNASSIASSFSLGTVTGSGYVGGLVGWNDLSTIDTSYSKGMVTGSGYVGGLVGKNGNGTNAQIINSFSEAAVTGHTDVGGLVGFNTGWIFQTSSKGAITGDAGSTNVGGLVGSSLFSSAKIGRSYSVGTVTAGPGSTNVGGLVGSNDSSATINNDHSESAVTAGADSTNVGGLTGTNSSSSTINQVFSTSAVTGTNNVGGLVGLNGDFASMSDAFSQGAVRGTYAVGGLVGLNFNSASMTNVYSQGAVRGTFYVGGLVGCNDQSSRISHVSSFGAVTGTFYVGGLVGSNTNNSTIDFALSVGSVTGSRFVGGLVGTNDINASASNAYWVTETSGRTTSAAGTGLTAEGLGSLADAGTRFNSNSTWWLTAAKSGVAKTPAVYTPVFPARVDRYSNAQIEARRQLAALLGIDINAQITSPRVDDRGNPIPGNMPAIGGVVNLRPEKVVFITDSIGRVVSMGTLNKY